MTEQKDDGQHVSLPESWEATPYGEHWSFACSPNRSDRKDYRFRIEFDDSVSHGEERVIISLIEASPRLLDVVQRLHGLCGIQANLCSTASEAERTQFISRVYELWNGLGIDSVAHATGRAA